MIMKKKYCKSDFHKGFVSCGKFGKKNSQNGEITLPFTDVGKTCINRKF